MKLYFGYGSNLCLKRFQARVPSAVVQCLAELAHHQMVFCKRSIDGSGKATIAGKKDATVWGALFTYADQHHGDLKKAEAGYSERVVSVATADGTRKALTFVCEPDKLDASLVPFDWYVDLIRHGGLSLGLPPEYFVQFEAVPTKIDLDTARVAKERAYLK
jgi:hypothetical protein